MAKRLKHVWHPIMLDAGEHWCIVCHAKNGELAPTCTGTRLAAHLHAKQREANELAYGVDTWVIASWGEDWSGATTVRKGDKLAP